MSQRFYIPFTQLFTNTGLIGAGYKLYTYQTLTSTPKATYSDVGLTIPNTNPIVADSSGRIGTDMFVADASKYKLVLTDQNGIVIQTTDPVNPATIDLSVLNPRPVFYAGRTSGTSSVYTLAATPPFISYSSTDTFELTFHTACAANPTLQYTTSGAALNLVKDTGQGTYVNLQAGDVQNATYTVWNNGIQIVVFNPRNKNIYTGTIPTLSVTTNTITLTNVGASYNIDTSSSAQTLNTINGLSIGEIITLGINSASNSLTINNGAGNIITSGRSTITLSTTSDKIIGIYDGTNLIILSVTSSTWNGMQLLSVQTASATTAIQFTSNITSAFRFYEFRFKTVLPSVTGTMLTAQVSINGGSNWINSSYLQANTWATTSDAPAGVANKTTGLSLTGSDANSQTCSDATAGINGKLTLYAPSDTVTHFASWETFYRTDTNHYVARTYGDGAYTGATTAINAIQFLMKTANSDTTNGNIASGIIEMWGVL